MIHHFGLYKPGKIHGGKIPGLGDINPVER
jgi:hypothetical protein